MSVPAPLARWRTRATDAARSWPPLGASDCEEFRGGLVNQPSNTVSSVAYIAAGALVAARGLRRHDGGQGALLAAGAVLAANGVGSVLYHGPGGAGSRWLHDVAVVSTSALIAARAAGELATSIGVDGLAARALAGIVPAAPFVAETMAAGAAMGVRPAAGTPLQAVLTGAAVALEVAAVVRTGAAARRPGWLLAGAALTGAGLTVNVLSRTGGPWCRPCARVQGHAVWHVLSAAGLAAWSVGALEPR